MSPVNVKKLEERWTSTTIESIYVLCASDLGSRAISVDLPLPSLGWTFALLLTPRLHTSKRPVVRHGASRKKVVTSNVSSWAPTVFSFCRQNNSVPWKDTSLRVQLLLATAEEPDDETLFAPSDNGSNSTLLADINVILGDTPSLERPLTLPHALSLLRPHRFTLTLAISECPLNNGLFGACLGLPSEGQVEGQLVKQRSDRLLSRSLTTGRPFDVKFLANSVRSLGKTGEPLSTYATLSVLEGHIDMSSSMLRESWTNALAAQENAGTNIDQEIVCPRDCDYELDSDFEDDEPPGDSGYEVDCLAAFGIPTGQQSEGGTISSSSSLSSFEPVDQSEEPTQNVNEPPLSYERTVWVKFAAYNTWHAFLWYCYTGSIKFCKLRSQVEPGLGYRHLPVEDGQPLCSPKSMYRLADLLGNKDLKAEALAAIKERMTEANVLDEAFSVFTSRYPDVRDVELAILLQHYKSPKVKDAFFRAMEKYGNMPHAKPVLSAFYDNLVARSRDCA